MQPFDLTAVLKDAPIGEWLALSYARDRIVAHAAGGAPLLLPSSPKQQRRVPYSCRRVCGKGGNHKCNSIRAQREPGESKSHARPRPTAPTAERVFPVSGQKSLKPSQRSGQPHPVKPAKFLHHR
jgi:hypothetical protein